MKSKIRTPLKSTLPLVALMALLFTLLAFSGYHFIMSAGSLASGGTVTAPEHRADAPIEPSVPDYAERTVLVSTENVLNILYRYDGCELYYTRTEGDEKGIPEGDFTVMINGIPAAATVEKRDGVRYTSLAWSDGRYRYEVSGNVGVMEAAGRIRNS